MSFDEDDLFPHKCVTQGCDEIVDFDDEPHCFEHSPDEGSYLFGYSAKADAEDAKDILDN